MARDETKKKKKTSNKKRKQRSSDSIDEAQAESSSKIRCCSNELVNEDESAKIELEQSSPWKNLELIVALQDKNIDLMKKVDVAFDYVKSCSSNEMDGASRSGQVLSSSRALVFLNNWVQSVFISSEKKTRIEGKRHESENSVSCLDFRCWKILHFCLEESNKFHVSLTCFRDFLRVIRCVAVDASSLLNDRSLCCEGTLPAEKVELYDIVLRCISLVFSCHGGVANENLDLWILLVDELLKLVLKIYTDQLHGSQMGNFVLQLSCYSLEPFAKFLRVHPTRKNGFHDFIDKLLTPLLHLLYLLHSNLSEGDIELSTNLSKLVDEVLAQALFHTTHIDGFLSLYSIDKYRNSSDATEKEERIVNKSYHRHLFDKVEKIVAENHNLASLGLGEMFRLFVSSVVKCKGASVTGRETAVSQKNPGGLNMDAELRKSIFNYFVQIIEFLLADVNKYLQSDREIASKLMNITGTLQSISNLLASFTRDKLYLRTEDTSEGAFKKFLRLIYDTVMSFSNKIIHLQTSSFASYGSSPNEHLASVRKELIVTVTHLLDIEYEVVGDDLESLWTMFLSSVPCSYSYINVLNQDLLSSEITCLGCKLFKIYSELRQVDSSVFAFCKAVRHSASIFGDSQSSRSSFSNSLSMLLCSSEFRLSLSNAIKAIPEGQAVGFIRQLCADIKESLEWIKFELQLAGATENSDSHPHNFDFRTELLGRVLSEVYTIILDSITVSSGNSYLFGVSLKNLIEIMRPGLSSLVSERPDGIIEFSTVINEEGFSKRFQCENVPTCWILVFFFRLLLSCKCLFRQAISLMPPDAAKKTSSVIGDSVTAHSGRDWLEMSGCPDQGFFSWILNPSAPLLSIIHFVSGICIQDSVVICPPLAYVLHAMALQRLFDLNRLIKSSEYMLHWNQNLGEMKLKVDGDSSSSCSKRTRKWKKCASEMREEATGLTDFMLGFLSSMVKDQISDPSLGGGIDGTVIQGLHNYDSSNVSVGFLDEKVLPIMLWCIICQNVDIWCSHASKKDLKKFLKVLIQTSLSGVRDHVDYFRIQNTDKLGHPKKVIAHQIALSFFTNTISYEQRFIRRFMASRFCRILQKSVLSIFDAPGVDLSRSPNWVDDMSPVGNLSDMQFDTLTWTKPNMIPAESCNEQASMEFATCQCMLALLMRMPEEYLSSSSSSLYITCILNLERLLVGKILRWSTTSCSCSPYEIFQFFLSCRRVLKVLTVATCKKYINESHYPFASNHSECSFPLSWLSKSLSAVVAFQHAFPEDNAFEAKVNVFSLIDLTSNVLLTVSRDQVGFRISSIGSNKKRRRERKSIGPTTKESGLSELDSQLNAQEGLDGWKGVLELANILEEDMQNSFTNFSDASLDKKAERLSGYPELNKLSSIIGCFHGLLQGLSSALGDSKAMDGNARIKFLKFNAELMTRIDSCVSKCINFLTSLLKSFFLEDNLTVNTSVCGGSLSGTKNSLSGGCDISNDTSNENRMSPTGEIVTSDTKNGLLKSSVDLEAFLSEVHHVKQCLKKSVLLDMLRVENAEMAFFFRQIFTACSAILRLNLLTDRNSISWALFPVVVGISQFLLLEFSTRSEMPHRFDFFWLDGVVKFLEALGSYLPQFDLTLSRDFYVELVDLHVRAIGKCISLQGKEAKLASQETGSRAKVLTDQVKTCLYPGKSRLDEFKERLRISFRRYVKESSELHLVSALQAVERALVGVQEDSVSSYEIVCGTSDGGEVSYIVAAGIDCLDLIIEVVTAHKHLNMVKRHIQSLVACLFNIILHLQAPSIFYESLDSIKGYESPDSGSVVLMCVEILAIVSGKPSFFQMDACHTAQSLRVPGALFQYFLQLQFSESTVKAATEISTTNVAIDREFAVELYSGCCRMLCTALKHHKNETWHCMALLQDSVSVLLHCLETVNVGPVAGTVSSAWEVQEAVKCASSLRRVYEEVRQQKDVLGNSSFQLLSRYIWVYCGFGPAKRGIIREVDEALRPGVYALIDSCSAEDLQLLHTVFGEGPCRSTLAALQHDYKVNFQYEGKV